MPTEPNYIKLKIINKYGYDVDVRSSADFIKDFTVPNGTERYIEDRTASSQYFVIRVYDRRDRIPILINGKTYVRMIPTSSPEYVYNILVKPGK